MVPLQNGLYKNTKSFRPQRDGSSVILTQFHICITAHTSKSTSWKYISYTLHYIGSLPGDPTFCSRFGCSCSEMHFDAAIYPFPPSGLSVKLISIYFFSSSLS